MDPELIDNRYGSLLRYCAEAVIIADANFLKILAGNDVAAKYLQLSANDLNGQSLDDHLSARTIKLLSKYVLEPVSGEGALELNCSIRGADDKRILVDMRAYVDTESGTPLLVICALETTQRKKTETRMRRSERLYYLLAKNLLGFIFSVDRHLQFTYVSPSVFQIRGYTDEETMAQSLEECFDSASYERLLDVLDEEYRKTPTADTDRVPVRTLEVQLTCKNGSTVWSEMGVSVYRREDGERLGFAAVCRDISATKSARQEKEHLKRQVQHAQKLESLGVLAGGIAHDFNNLLTGILGYANMLKSEIPEDSPSHNRAERIELAAERAHILTKQMLAYSGRGSFDIRRINLSVMVAEIAHLLEAAIPKKVHLDFVQDSDLPLVEADTAQLQQVVMNLITNAADAIGSNSGKITLRTGSMIAGRDYLSQSYIDDDLPGGRYVFLEVADTGIGMEHDTVSKIFDPFYTTKFTGRGLGLASVLGIVRSHRGSIQIDTRPGQGSTFRVLLPAVEAKSETPLRANVPVEMPAVWAEQSMVLVADDDEVVRSLLHDTLKSTGLEVLVATDGLEAVTLYHRHSDDVRIVFLDLTMPNMDGTEALRRIRDLNEDVPIVLSSGYAEQEVLSRLEDSSDVIFVQKPFRPRELLWVVRDIINPS